MGDNQLISLKEAAKLSGYTPDYIGQLIRAGKIPGKQVYCNIAWMTTAEAVMEYKNKGQQNGEKKCFGEVLTSQKRKIMMQFDIVRLFFRTFKSALPVLLLVIVSFLALSFYIVYGIAEKAGTGTDVSETPAREESLSY